MYEVMEYTIMSDVYDEYIEMHPAMEAFGKKKSLWDKIIGVFKLIIKKIKKFFYRISGQEDRDKRRAIAVGGIGASLVAAFVGIRFFSIKNKNQLRDKDIQDMKEEQGKIKKNIEVCRKAMEKIQSGEASKKDQIDFYNAWISKTDEITKTMNDQLKEIEIVRDNTEGDKHLKKFTDEQETILKEYAETCQQYLQLANDLQKLCEQLYPHVAEANKNANKNKDKDKNDKNKDKNKANDKDNKELAENKDNLGYSFAERRALQVIKETKKRLGPAKNGEDLDTWEKRSLLVQTYDSEIYEKSNKTAGDKKEREDFVLKYGPRGKKPSGSIFKDNEKENTNHNSEETEKPSGSIFKDNEKEKEENRKKSIGEKLAEIRRKRGI